MALGWRNQYLRYKDFFLNIVAVYKKRPDLKVFLELVLSISTVTIFIVFALKPTAVTIIGLVKEIDEKEKIIAGLDQKILDLGTASRLYVENQEKLAILDLAVPEEPNPESIAQQVQGLAQKNSVEVLGLSIGQVTLIGKDSAPKKDKDVTPLPENSHAIPISISIKGSYPSLNAFIHDFENLRLASKVDVLGVSSSAGETEQIITVSISGRVPYVRGITNNEAK